MVEELSILNKESKFTEIEEEDTSSLSEISVPFDPKEIDIDTKSLTLDLLIKRLKADPPEIDLYPDFQRNYNLWSKTQQSRLIESILIRLPLPAFYFDGSDNYHWLVIDGLQRLGAIKNFVIEQTLILQNLEFLHHLEGKKFNELPKEFQRRIEETQIIAFIIKPGTPEDVKFTIFHRINTGGVSLSSQEIRHALFQGKPAQLVGKLADNEHFKEATGYINPLRMVDRNFVTRFVSFYLLSYQNYEPDLDSFLNQGMKIIYNIDNEALIKIEEHFNYAMLTAISIFGPHSFRKISKRGESPKPLNKALFEVWSVALAKLNEENRLRLVENREIVLNEFIILMNNNQEFNSAISHATGDKRRVIARFSTIEKLIQDILKNHAEEHTNQKLQGNQGG